MTQNTLICEQISLWRLKNNKVSLVKHPESTIRKLSAMFDVVKDNYNRQVARAFWKIEKSKIDQTERSVSSDADFERRYIKADIKTDFYSEFYAESRRQSRNPSKSRAGMNKSIEKPIED